ncbi:MAG: PaaI family thioesterase [Rhodoblastus sp.]|nr:PaaI family thioesterase [Rhodoblastus sp.]MCB9999187.1 PaaI family thioesterase [Methylobacteriaceae bacterium]MCC0003170.1 PaaI family thioesterase [Methylobacteriaceae bacterium]
MIDVNIMPLARLMGIRLVEQTPDKVVAEMEVREDLCTTNSILHGGAYMAFADTIGAVATVLNLPPGAGTTTVESKTNFISAIRAGEIARAECTPVHRGKTTQVWTTRILRPDGKLAAIVTQTQMVLAARAKA